MRYVVLGFCLTVACLISEPVQAQVHVNIGINLPAPPQWVVVPGPVATTLRSPASFRS